MLFLRLVPSSTCTWAGRSPKTMACPTVKLIPGHHTGCGKLGPEVGFGRGTHHTTSREPGLGWVHSVHGCSHPAALHIHTAVDFSDCHRAGQQSVSRELHIVDSGVDRIRAAA